MLAESSYFTLVLNADYRPLSYFPLSLCSWQEAIKAALLDRVHVVSEYDRKVRSPSTELKIPSVVSLKRYVSINRHRPALTRQNVYLRDEYTCQYCGRPFEAPRLSIDHVIPRARGGKTRWTNIVAACNPCNADKGDKMPGRHYQKPLRAPYCPSPAELQEISRRLHGQRFHESWMAYLKNAE